MNDRSEISDRKVAYRHIKLNILLIYNYGLCLTYSIVNLKIKTIDENDVSKLSIVSNWLVVSVIMRKKRYLYSLIMIISFLIKRIVN